MKKEERAKKLEVRKDYETAKRIAFTVIDKEKGTSHSVFYSKEKKEWFCDCKWYSTKYDSTKKHCSHIIAAKNKSNFQM